MSEDTHRRAPAGDVEEIARGVVELRGFGSTVARDELEAAIASALRSERTASSAELAEYKRRSELNPLSGYSCNGVNVWGDEKSMKAVRSAFWQAGFQKQVADELRRRLEASAARERVLVEALTPSADTKAAYMGEFSFSILSSVNEHGDEPEEVYRDVTVPWTTIKEVMAAIRAYAARQALSQERGEDEMTAPEGFRLVPVETLEKLENGPEVLAEALSYIRGSFSVETRDATVQLRNDLIAMLAAVPSEPAGEAETGPERAHTVILKAGADTATELAWHLRHMADQIERSQLTVGCSGGPSAGSVYSYRVLPEQTHDAYFRQIDEWLARSALHADGGAA